MWNGTEVSCQAPLLADLQLTSRLNPVSQSVHHGTSKQQVRLDDNPPERLAGDFREDFVQAGPRQGQESLIDSVPVRQTKRYIAGTQVDVDTEFLFDPADCFESYRTSITVCTNGQDMGVDDGFVRAARCEHESERQPGAHAGAESAHSCDPIRVLAPQNGDFIGTAARDDPLQ